MGIFDFFKKKEPEIKEDKISFNDVGNWVINKEKDINSKEKEAIVSIKDRTSLLVKDLNEKVKVLENIDMDSKKVEDRIKVIVKGNLETYIGYVKILIENIGGLNEERPKDFICLVKKNFSDFEKNSYKSYQKSTFIIGKEIGDLKQSIVDFSKYLQNISNKHKDVIDSPEINSFLSLKLNLKQLDDLDKRVIGIEKHIKLFDNKIKDFKKVEEKKLNEIEEIKKSEDYVNNFKKIREIEVSDKELIENINELKNLIDFKALGNEFHSSEKEMNLVKSYKQNFQLAFLEDKSEKLLSLIREAKGKDISSEVKKINDKREKISEEKLEIKKDETENLLDEIKKVKLDIDNLNNEKGIELKKLEKIKVNKEDLVNSIKKDLKSFNVVVE